MHMFIETDKHYLLLAKRVSFYKTKSPAVMASFTLSVSFILLTIILLLHSDGLKGCKANVN